MMNFRFAQLAVVLVIFLACPGVQAQSQPSLSSCPNMKHLNPKDLYALQYTPENKKSNSKLAAGLKHLICLTKQVVSSYKINYQISSDALRLTPPPSGPTIQFTVSQICQQERKRKSSIKCLGFKFDHSVVYQPVDAGLYIESTVSSQTYERL